MEIATWHLIGRLLLAAGLGAVIGAEREFHNKAAGLRTNTLIALGAAIFTLLSLLMAQGSTADPTRITSQIVTGIGFLGGGVILRTGLQVQGLTTAATIWVNAAIGAAAGAGQYRIAIAATVTALFVLAALAPLDTRLERAGRAEDPSSD